MPKLTGGTLLLEEEGLAGIKPGLIKHALFDSDGTISLLRAKWDLVMAPMMCRAICGESVEVPREVAEVVHDTIEETTGIRTIRQMELLVNLVRGFGLVPADQVKDAWGYKADYLAALMVPVNERVARVQAGACKPEHFMVRGIGSFLELFGQVGIDMRVFSGTDEPDVRRELEVLGVLHYFTSVHGAAPALKPGEPEIDKEQVLQALIEEQGLEGEEVLIIGDGPVEIKLARQFGCWAIGVCSQEGDERGGYDQAKVKRLTKAGAHVLIPDFSGACRLARERFKVASIIEPANFPLPEDDDMLSLLGFIRNQVMNGEFKPGDLLPAPEEFVQRFSQIVGHRVYPETVVGLYNASERIKRHDDDGYVIV